MKVTTRQKVVEEKVLEYEPGDIVCVDHNEIRRKWAIVVDKKDAQGFYEAIPIEYPTSKVGFNIWIIKDDEVCKDCDVLHVPIKDISDVTVTEKEAFD